MAPFLKRFAPATSALLLGLFLMTSCGTDTSPISADSETGPVGGIPDNQFEPIAFGGSSADPFAAAKQTDKKIKPITVRELITQANGGQLLLDWESKDEIGATGSKIKAEVKIFPDALDHHTMISISLLNPVYAMLSVDLEFGAHGTQFHIPAEVMLDLEGMDLSGYGEGDTLNFYWYDPDTDAWYPVPRDEDQFKMELDQGKVYGIWYFAHFSRYSLGGRRR